MYCSTSLCVCPKGAEPGYEHGQRYSSNDNGQSWVAWGYISFVINNVCRTGQTRFEKVEITKIFSHVEMPLWHKVQ